MCEAIAPQGHIPDYMQRVLLEECELNERLGKLVVFMKSAVFAGLDTAERDRLERQARAMSVYVTVLRERLDAFKRPAALT